MATSGGVVATAQTREPDRSIIVAGEKAWPAPSHSRRPQPSHRWLATQTESRRRLTTCVPEVDRLAAKRTNANGSIVVSGLSPESIVPRLVHVTSDGALNRRFRHDPR
ncbi:MAG: hypothetical protein KatS3mg060_2649 [Dehalococcoidia bacterium]|nr:MAG: hypothetical protein KatS3mg060_2649 [Dehalococcoidia bacterium]